MAIAPNSSLSSDAFGARLATAMFCVGLAIALSMCYAIVQPDALRGLEQVRNTAAVSICLLLLPHGYRELRQWLKISPLSCQPETPSSEVGLDAMITLLGLASLLGLRWLELYLLIKFAPLFWGLALVLLGISVRRFVPEKLEREHVLVGAIALTFYAYLAWMIWGTHGYMSPRPVTKLLTESLHIDTLFHSSIAAMIRTHGIPSTGLDGPVYLPYHTGSHWLFAQLSGLLDLSVFRFYNLAYPILIMPLLFRSILAFAVDLRSFGCATLSWDLRKDWLFWGLLAVCFIGFLPTELILKLGIGLTSPLISQSHLSALSLTFFTLCLCLRLIFKFNEGKFSWSTGLLVMSISLLLASITLCKVSIGFLLFNLLLYTVLRLRLYRRWPIAIGLGAAIFLQFQTLKYMGYFGDYPTASTPIHLFAYFEDYVDPSVQVFSLPILFIWASAYIFLRLRALKLHTLRDLVKVGQTGITIDAEILVLICLMGLAPGLLLRIAGGGAYYFMDFQMWFSLSLLLGMAYCSNVWHSLVNLKPQK